MPGAMFLAGCHNYVPVDVAPVGAAVRVLVPVQSALADPNAPASTASIEGDVVSDGDTLVLALVNRQEYGAFREIVRYDTLRLGPDQRTRVEVKQFSNGKSVALGVGIAVGVAILAVSAFGGLNGGGPDDMPPPPPQGALVFSPSLLSSLWSVFGR